jgi:hypothetical protein
MVSAWPLGRPVPVFFFWARRGRDHAFIGSRCLLMPLFFGVILGWTWIIFDVAHNQERINFDF